MFFSLFFSPEFAFPWCMMDGQRSGCCSNWHIWSLWLVFSSPNQTSLAEEFLFLVKRFMQVILVTLFVLICHVDCEQFRNVYWSSWKMHDWHFLVSLSHEIFPNFFFFFFWLRSHFLLHDWPRSVLTLVEIGSLEKKKEKKICYSAYRFKHIIHLSTKLNTFWRDSSDPRYQLSQRLVAEQVESLLGKGQSENRAGLAPGEKDPN